MTVGDEHRAIIVVFTRERLTRIVQALTIIHACHSGLLMEDAKAMHEIVLAVATKKKMVVI